MGFAGSWLWHTWQGKQEAGGGEAAVSTQQALLALYPVPAPAKSEEELISGGRGTGVGTLGPSVEFRLGLNALECPVSSWAPRNHFLS